jgi:hypothetical protein
MKQRTLTQNAALHLYFTRLAEALDAGGYDVTHTLKHSVDIPWNPVLVKELLWKVIQLPMTEKHSTAELDRVEVGHIYEVLNRHLGQKLGIHVPFPSEEG